MHITLPQAGSPRIGAGSSQGPPAAMQVPDGAGKVQTAGAARPHAKETQMGDKHTGLSPRARRRCDRSVGGQ